jgi:hypothetical protein
MKTSIKTALINLLMHLGFRKKIEYRWCKQKVLMGSNYAQWIRYDNGPLIFIHIPKSAGMSMVKALYGKSKSHHAKAIDYKLADPKKFNEKVFFAITRNPYARLYSAYNYLQSGGMNLIDSVWYDLYLKKYKNFDDFIMNGLEIAIKENAEHFIPQYKFVVDQSGTILCDFIGELDDMETTISFLNTYGIKLELGHENVSPNNSEKFERLFTKTTIDKVNQLYEQDFKLFGYDML